MRVLNYLNLSIVLGAVLSQRLVARLSDAVEPIHWATPLVLALAVWLIYTVDRLLDVGKPNPPQTARHLFHRQHYTRLWQAVWAAAALMLVLGLFLPGSVIRFGLVLAGLCGVYVLLVWRLPERHPALLLKEPLVALLYTAGIWGSVWAQRAVITNIELAEGVLFGLVACQNLLLFSIYEQLTPGPPAFSLATAWSVATCDRVLRWLTLVVALSAVGLCFIHDVPPGGGPRFAQRAALIIGIMSLTLYAIQRYPAWFARRDRYRWLGDAVFWFPALVL